jgi:hypothetical protein
MAHPGVFAYIRIIQTFLNTNIRACASSQSTTGSQLTSDLFIWKMYFLFYHQFTQSFDPRDQANAQLKALEARCHDAESHVNRVFAEKLAMVKFMLRSSFDTAVAVVQYYAFFVVLTPLSLLYCMEQLGKQDLVVYGNPSNAPS